MSLSAKQEANYGSIINNLDNRFAEKKKNILMDIDNNKRSKEIAKYYSSKYKVYADLFFYACIIVIIYLLIRYLEVIGLLPSFIVTPFLLLLSTLGVLYFLYILFDINMRSNINFDKYKYNYNDKYRNTTPAKYLPGNNSCIGADCCPVGTTFDISLNKCTL
jgi:hypothetical protein